MQFDITITKVETVLTAVVRDLVSPKALAQFVPAACGEVWSFIRSARLQRPGRHVALYKVGGVVEVGVEIPAEFVGNDRVHCSRLPGGEVATTTHYGPYARLGETHEEVRRWCAARRYRLAGVCWEIYGHWEESWNGDPGRIRTDVFHLLEGSNG